ncbi:hypothetical protein D3C87_1950420 [compost metagenome]
MVQSVNAFQKLLFGFAIALNVLANRELVGAVHDEAILPAKFCKQLGAAPTILIAPIGDQVGEL